MGTGAANEVQLLETSLDVDLFGSAIRLVFPGPLAPASVRVCEESVADGASGRQRKCLCVSAVTLTGTVHRLAFPHPSDIDGTSAGTDGAAGGAGAGGAGSGAGAAAASSSSSFRPLGGSSGLSPSVFNRFADDTPPGVEPPLVGIAHNHGVRRAGRTSCLRADVVALDLRKGTTHTLTHSHTPFPPFPQPQCTPYIVIDNCGTCVWLLLLVRDNYLLAPGACVMCATWLDANTVAVGSSSGAVVLLKLRNMRVSPLHHGTYQHQNKTKHQTTQQHTPSHTYIHTSCCRLSSL